MHFPSAVSIGCWWLTESSLSWNCHWPKESASCKFTPSPWGSSHPITVQCRHSRVWSSCFHWWHFWRAFLVLEFLVDLDWKLCSSSLPLHAVQSSFLCSLPVLIPRTLHNKLFLHKNIRSTVCFLGDLAWNPCASQSQSLMPVHSHQPLQSLDPPTSPGGPSTPPFVAGMMADQPWLQDLLLGWNPHL